MRPSPVSRGVSHMNMKKINLEFVKKEIIRAEKDLIEPDKRAIRLWERIKITPTEWSNNQYP